MHGYQLMQTMSERTQGAWRPSPGAIYPTINQLEDEGLVTISTDGGRKLVTLTQSGHDHVEQSALGDPFDGFTDRGPRADLRGLLEELHGAARQLARIATAEQRAAAEQVLVTAKRSLYLILAGQLPTAAEASGDDQRPES